MKLFLGLFVLMIFQLTSLRARADFAVDDYAGPLQWNSFQHYMKERREEDRVQGLSYMISGAVATLGGIAGYYNAEDSFSRGVYAITQSVGVAAIAYGATTYWNGNEYDSFFYAVESAMLTAEQKADLLRKFMEKEKAEHRQARWIRIVTHSLLAAANLYSAVHEQDRGVKNVLYFLSGTNAVVAFSYAF